MKVLLLLAGRSKRFWPLHEKTLFPICGRTLLEIQVERLRQVGLKDIILVGGTHNLAQAKALLPDLPTIEQSDLSLGMRGALLSALPSISRDPVLIVSGNDVIDAQGFASVLAIGKKEKTGGALLARRVSSYFPGGYLTTTGDRVTSIVEKPEPGKEPGDLVNIVVHLHQSPHLLLEALRSVGDEGDDGYERALALLFKEHPYHAVPYEGFWQPIKYPWHLLPLLSHLLTEITTPSIHRSASIHPSAVIEGNVIIDEGVRIFPHAAIVGPCFIGKHSVVANNALVRQASIGDRCVVGYSTEVKSSVLARDVWTHMTYIGDSIVGENVSFGAGTVLGNLRLDEGEISSVVGEESLLTHLRKFGAAIGDHCRLGIHVGTNPGVKIGQGSFIGSGTLVNQDIPERSFVSVKGGVLTIRENRSSPPTAQSRSNLHSIPKPKTP
ncbi:MAG: NTP transferase domain-containing protein [Candidatus Peribacteraceae bacterium]|nr:NTP transferase domain-containing protein [Candidatus Peribacteraceae bacterium]